MPAPKDNTLAPETWSYIEAFALHLERTGLQRMAGRVFAALLVSPKPELSADELANMLHASRGAISNATRLLEQGMFVLRTRKPRDRKDYFFIRPGLWTDANRKRAAELSTFRELALRGLELHPEAHSASAKALKEMHLFCQFWEETMPKIHDAWEAYLLKHSSAATRAPAALQDG